MTKSPQAIRRQQSPGSTALGTQSPRPHTRAEYKQQPAHQGPCARPSSQRLAVKGAPALPVRVLQYLEDLIATSPDPTNRITTRAILFGIFSCARAISLQADLPDNPKDTTWFHSSVENAKTAIGGRRRLQLPRPCRGLQAALVQSLAAGP